MAPKTGSTATTAHVPYTGDPLPDDIVRLILKYAAEKGIAARLVCKTWLNVSNSLTPYMYFINRMKAFQELNARIKEASKKIAMARVFDSEQEQDMDWAEMSVPCA